ncbi:MAG: hypothetical protein U0990_09355 [Candidatus Nanopelagicales bacterium]|nr:hypothetical protein [Candidatus Nanopelagicales bacterium]
MTTALTIQTHPLSRPIHRKAARWPTIDVDPGVQAGSPAGRGPRLAPVEALEPGERVTIRNAYHDTTAACTVNKHGRLSARSFRALCVHLCAAVATRDLCKCEGPHGDPDYAFVPLGGDLTRCEWQICRRPPARAPSRAGAVAMGIGRFAFLTALPYVVAVAWVLGVGILRRTPRMIGFTVKLLAFGFVLFWVLRLSWYLHAAATM